MKRSAGFALMLACVLVQVTWAPRLQIAGAFPNLVLVAVVALSWTCGVRAGLVWACVGGLLLDLTATGPLGPHAVALLPGAYATGFWARNLDRASHFHPAVATVASTVLYSLILIASDQLLGLPVPPMRLALELILAAAIYNAVLMPVALAGLRAMQMISRARPAAA